MGLRTSSSLFVRRFFLSNPLLSFFFVLLLDVTRWFSFASAFLSHINGSDPNMFPPDREDSDPFASSNSDDLDILFSPAEHTDGLKRRKERKRRERREKRKAMKNDNATPRVRNSAYLHNHAPSGLSSRGAKSATNVGTTSTATRKTMATTRIESRQGTPPASRPPKAHQNIDLTEEEDVW